MGPGYFPVILSWLIIAIGAVIGLMSLFVEGPPVEAPQFRPILFVLLSIVIFGYLMTYVGLAITGVVMTLRRRLSRGAKSIC